MPKARGGVLNPSVPTDSIVIKDMLSPDRYQRLLAHYDRLRDPEMQAVQQGMFFDLSQNVGYTYAGPRLPTVLRNSLLWSTTCERPVTSRELLLSLGMPCLGGDSDMVCPYIGMVDELAQTPTALRSLAGNAMGLASIGSWVMYCLSNLVSKDSLTPYSYGIGRRMWSGRLGRNAIGLRTNFRHER